MLGEHFSSPQCVKFLLFLRAPGFRNASRLRCTGIAHAPTAGRWVVAAASASRRQREETDPGRDSFVRNPATGLAARALSSTSFVHYSPYLLRFLSLPQYISRALINYPRRPFKRRCALFSFVIHRFRRRLRELVAISPKSASLEPFAIRRQRNSSRHAHHCGFKERKKNPPPYAQFDIERSSFISS